MTVLNKWWIFVAMIVAFAGAPFQGKAFAAADVAGPAIEEPDPFPFPLPPPPLPPDPTDPGSGEI